MNAKKKLTSLISLTLALCMLLSTVAMALDSTGASSSDPGKGSFLAGRDEAKRRQKARGVRALRAALQEAMDSGLTGPEIRRECEDYLREREGKRL